MLVSVLLNERWKQPGDSTWQRTFYGHTSMGHFGAGWASREKRTLEGKGEDRGHSQKSTTPYWMEENIIYIFPTAKGNPSFYIPLLSLEWLTHQLNIVDSCTGVKHPAWWWGYNMPSNASRGFPSHTHTHARACARVFIHGVCMESFLIMVGWNGKLQ